MQEVLVKRRADDLDYKKRAGIPRTSMAIDSYIKEREALQDKRPATIKREKSSLAHWKTFAGDTLINRITDRTLFDFASWMRTRKTKNGVKQATAGRSVDVAIVAIRSVLKKALRDGHIVRMTVGKWKPIAPESKTARLMTNEEVEKLIESAGRLKQGSAFVDYLRFLQYSGAREMEALRIHWSNVNFDHKQLTIGADGLSKNGLSRVVPMSEKLEAHLREMHARKKDDLLFPSSRKASGVITSYKASLRKIKKLTAINDIGFHHFRHYFVSHAVMSGIDYKTIAEWVGHQDGGIMVAKTYSHLNNEHQKKQAEKLKF